MWETWVETKREVVRSKTGERSSMVIQARRPGMLKREVGREVLPVG